MSRSFLSKYLHNNFDYDCLYYLSYKIYSGTKNDHEIFILESGIGKVNSARTTQILID